MIATLFVSLLASGKLTLFTVSNPVLSIISNYIMVILIPIVIFYSVLHYKNSQDKKRLIFNLAIIVVIYNFMKHYQIVLNNYFIGTVTPRFSDSLLFLDFFAGSNLLDIILCIYILIWIIENLKIVKPMLLVLFLLFQFFAGWVALSYFFDLMYIPIIPHSFALLIWILSIWQFGEGFLFVILGILFYFVSNDKKKLAISYSLYCLTFFLIVHLQIGIRLLLRLDWLAFHFPLLQINLLNTLSNRDFNAFIMENLLGLNPWGLVGVGFNDTPSIIYDSYHWIMILALPFILFFIRQTNKKLFYGFCILYSFNMILFHHVIVLLYT